MQCPDPYSCIESAVPIPTNIRLGRRCRYRSRPDTGFTKSNRKKQIRHTRELMSAAILAAVPSSNFPSGIPKPGRVISGSFTKRLARHRGSPVGFRRRYSRLKGDLPQETGFSEADKKQKTASSRFLICLHNHLDKLLFVFFCVVIIRIGR
jgi:hypothetical protein